MADADLSTLLGGLTASPQQPPLAQLGSALAGLGAGLQGQPNPVLQQQEAEFRQRVLAIHTGLAVQKMREGREKAKQDLLLTIARGLPDDNPVAMRKKLEIYGQLGATTLSPELVKSVEGQAKAAQFVKNLPLIAGGMKAGLTDQELQALYPASIEGFDLSKLRQMTPERLSALGGPAAEKAQADITLTREKAETERRKHLVVPKTPLAKQALEEAGLNPDAVTDPQVIQTALTKYRAARQKEKLEQAAVLGQLTQMGAVYRTELNRVTMNVDRIGRLDTLGDDAERLIKEGKDLGLTTNPKFLNAAMQELTAWTGGPLSKGAEWVRAFGILDARYASVAQGLENVTGNRLALTLAQKALGFHPKASDPYNVQTRILNELRLATRRARRATEDDMARVMRQYQAAAGSAGVPFILGQERQRGGWAATPEEPEEEE